MARHQLSARSNYMIANSPSAASIADVWTVSVVGDGPSVRSGHPVEATRTALEDAWGRFYSSCDQEGVADLGGLLSGFMRSIIISGEGLLHFVTTPRGELRLRLLSPEQLDPARTRELENIDRIIAGVEFETPPDGASPITFTRNSRTWSAQCHGAARVQQRMVNHGQEFHPAW
jgi:hypothetical protein